VGLVAVVAESGGDDTVLSEARIEAAVGVVADECEVEAGGVRQLGLAGYDHLAARQRERGARHRVVADRRRHLAAVAEAPVQAAVRAVAGDRDLPVEPVLRPAGGDEPPVRLDDDVRGTVSLRTEVGRRDPVAVEARVQVPRRCRRYADGDQGRRGREDRRKAQSSHVCSSRSLR
jgi:hypothetical protein